MTNFSYLLLFMCLFGNLCIKGKMYDNFSLESRTKESSQPLICVECSEFSQKLSKETKYNNDWLKDNIIPIFGNLIALVGLFSVFYQLRRQTKNLAAELALRLDDKIAIHRDIYKELFKGGKFYDEIPNEKTEDIEFYLTFYDTLHLLVKNKEIRIENVNQMYGYRFLITLHNPSVQKIILQKNDSWEGIKELYKKVLKYRRKRKLDIPREENEWLKI